MAGLAPAFTLVVVGDGPARRRLEAHANDLQVSSRVRFVGRISDADLYRWLRTASALVSLAEQQPYGLELIEAMAAGVPGVASDTPVHREVASRVDGADVTLVKPEGSPFEVADAIAEAVERSSAAGPPAAVQSWGSLVERVLWLYEALTGGPPLRGQNRRKPKAASGTLDSAALG
jgi:glycosyltransferase involved in cell wall biosynthesis